MYMFSRVGRMVGGIRKPLEWATEITEKVNSITDNDVTLWGGTFGYPLGTLAWSTAVETRAHLADMNAKLLADDGYLDLVEKGQEFTSGEGEDHLRNVLHMTVEAGDPPAVGAQAEILTATPAEGKISDAMEWGVKMADLYTEVTGTGVAFLADAYGTFGQVTWMAAHDDAAAAQAAEEATMGSEAYGKALDEDAGLFLPGSGTRGLVTRLA